MNQLLGAPITVTVTAIFGVFATSAVANKYGKTIWQPIQLLEFLLDNNYDSKTRAGCFFAGLGFFVSQISVSRHRGRTRRDDERREETGL